MKDGALKVHWNEGLNLRTHVRIYRSLLGMQDILAIYQNILYLLQDADMTLQRMLLEIARFRKIFVTLFREVLNQLFMQFS